MLQAELNMLYISIENTHTEMQKKIIEIKHFIISYHISYHIFKINQKSVRIISILIIEKFLK